MSSRTVEDRLRSEYCDLLPHVRRVADEAETEVRYQKQYADVIRALASFEQEFDAVAAAELQIVQGS